MNEPRKDTEYYNEESIKYTQKRYPALLTTFTHFLFSVRLSLLLSMLREMARGKEQLDLIEVGCADGIVLGHIKQLQVFSQLYGVDISPGMIEVAKRMYADQSTQFSVRDDRVLQTKTFDVVVEVGVLNLTDVAQEVALAASMLRDDGRYICSVAGSTSLSALFKPQNRSSYVHLRRYSQYERELESAFHIERRVAYGLFIPYLWKFPSIARRVQPAVEAVLRPMLPWIFHEQLYVLRKRSSRVITG